MQYTTKIYKTVDSDYDLIVTQMVDKIVASEKLSRQDHSLLISTILADGEISEVERRQINRIFDLIQTGQLKLIDW